MHPRVPFLRRNPSHCWLSPSRSDFEPAQETYDLVLLPTMQEDGHGFWPRLSNLRQHDFGRLFWDGPSFPQRAASAEVDQKSSRSPARPLGSQARRAWSTGRRPATSPTPCLDFEPFAMDGVISGFVEALRFASGGIAGTAISR